ELRGLRIEAGLASPFRGEPRLLEVLHAEAYRLERLPVGGERAMEPDEVPLEMTPRRIDASRYLEVGEVPRVLGRPPTGGLRAAPLGKARMGEGQDGDPARPQDPVEARHRALQVRGVHQDIVG